MAHLLILRMSSQAGWHHDMHLFGAFAEHDPMMSAAQASPVLEREQPQQFGGRGSGARSSSPAGSPVLVVAVDADDDPDPEDATAAGACIAVLLRLVSKRLRYHAKGKMRDQKRDTYVL